MNVVLQGIKAENDASPEGPTKCFAVNPQDAPSVRLWLYANTAQEPSESDVGRYQRRSVEIYPEPRMPVGTFWRIS
jgi:hypothetical protein